ncbi:MAG: hypothetical protein IPF99_43375 [Deltaproteobacteria bacterium]|nr:hypothetical protein [Deltaproteobacteria bacterium]
MFANARPDTALDALGLSARARNALDRSGIVNASQLARVPENLLSSIRGIGRDTAREIQDARRHLLSAPGLAAVEEPEFSPGFRGEDTDLEATKLTEALRRRLEDAGLHDLAALAAAPRSQVEHLARAHGADALAKLHAALKEASDASERTRDPRTVEAWLDALFDPRQRHPNQKSNYQQTAWRWMGLDTVVAVDPGDSIALATKLGCTRQNVSLMLGKAREKWAKHPLHGRLIDGVRAQLDGLGGAARVERVAEALGVALPHDAGADHDPLAARRVEALVSVAASLAGDLVVEWVHDRRWLVRDRRELAAVRALGQAAEALAGKVPLPSTAEVQEELARAVADCCLAALPIDRLATLAADASRTAARSARPSSTPAGWPRAGCSSSATRPSSPSATASPRSSPRRGRTTLPRRRGAAVEARARRARGRRAAAGVGRRPRAMAPPRRARGAVEQPAQRGRARGAADGAARRAPRAAYA